MATPPAHSTPPTLLPIAALSAPSTARAWQSFPHPTSPLLATATAERTATIWSLRNFRLLSTITGGHKRSVRSVRWKDTLRGKQAPEGAGEGPSGTPIVLATGSFDSNVGIWTRNERYGQPRDDGKDCADDEDEEWAFSCLLTGHDSEVKSVAFSPTNPALLASSSRDKSVWVWEDVADTAGSGGGGEESEYETVAVLNEHTGDVKCVAWHPEREVLASGSYDDTVRLWREVEEEGDWVCVGVLEGHGGTVWEVGWEGVRMEEGHGGWRERRLISCSDDLSVRVWRRVVKEKEKEKGTSGPRLPSIIRPASSMEEWVLDAVLPQMHFRSVYSVAWSSTTGLVVSCGGDGGIYVYQEQEVMKDGNNGADLRKDTVMNGTEESNELHVQKQTEWVVIAQVEAAHAEYEINHVCWARRHDRDQRQPQEEVIVSSGDDGVVKIWALPEF